MLVTFGRPYFSFHIALTIKKLFGFQVCGGERTETKAPPRKGRDFFSICVGFRVRRATFQSEPQQAENLTVKREKASDMKRQQKSAN